MDNTKQDILTLISHHIELQESITELLSVDLTQFGLTENVSDIFKDGTDAAQLMKIIHHNVDQSITLLMRFYTQNEP